ncbi:endonuclease V [Limisphaera sp. 4302-co]|uniref:endonuclease V n=1 Tax=Limisphaera sp. 4302-co TaxID=3400417 RepID=UPI003C29ECE1
MTSCRPSLKWTTSPRVARELQLQLAAQVRLTPLPRDVRWVAGLDATVSPNGRWMIGVATLWDLQEQCVAEGRSAWLRLRFPYVPGLLSFREAPVLLAALRKLRKKPDLLLCDGQGRAHPRRFGLACHLGVLCDLPSVGCAKTRLVGEATEPGPAPGDWVPLLDQGEVVGAVVRTRPRSKPVYVSVGHRCTLEDAIRVVLACCRGHRLPEPTRRSDRTARLVRRFLPAGRLTS